jgi:hypothetical protein
MCTFFLPGDALTVERLIPESTFTTFWLLLSLSSPNFSSAVNNVAILRGLKNKKKKKKKKKKKRKKKQGGKREPKK